LLHAVSKLFFAQEALPTPLAAGGSPDPSTNVHLATVLKRVKDQGVPKENIEKALDKVGYTSTFAIPMLTSAGAK